LFGIEKIDIDKKIGRRIVFFNLDIFHRIPCFRRDSRDLGDRKGHPYAVALQLQLDYGFDKSNPYSIWATTRVAPTWTSL